MNRSIRIGLFAELVVVLLVLASCSAFTTTARVTPTPSAAAKGPAVANGGGPQVNLSTCAPGSQSEPFDAYALKMTSRTTGWALGQCALSARPSFPNGSTLQCYWPQSEFMGILRTSDGGATWTDVSPPSVANRTWYHTQFFLDANHAWVGEVSRTADACASQVTMFMTSDAGGTWQQGGTVAIKTTAPTDDVFNVYGPTDGMDFADTQHGWLMVSSPPSNPQPGVEVDSVMLYATADGGLHWSLVTSNPGKAACQSTTIYSPASDVAFSSATAGWLAISCPALTVLTTRDAGATWTAKALPNCSCQVYQPVYFDADRAVITGQQGSPVMLTTGDAGASWKQLQVPVAASSQFSFIDPKHGWMVGIEQLPKSYDTVVYGTIDGGQSWQLLGKPPFATATSSSNLYYPIQGVQFVDANTGFVMLGPEAGAQGATDPTMPQLQILSTVDGGRTWNTVLKQVPAASCSQNFTQLGFGNGAIWPVKMASATIGWARGGLRTTDGGAHWRDMSPPALRGGSATPLYPPGYTESYLDGDHAWQAAVYGSKTTCADHISTFATADGGKTWQPSAPIMLNLRAGYQTGAVQMGFTSPLAGWLWIPTGAQTNGAFDTSISVTDADLYTTSDGGLTWRHASSLSSSQLRGIPAPTGSQNCTPSLGQVAFSSPAVGWLSLNCSASPILVSRDGGATWKVQNFPISSDVGCPCSVEMPNFTDANHGIVSVSGQSGLPGTNLLLTTTDGGVTWRKSARPGTGYVLLLDFVNSNDLFALVTPPGWSKLSTGGFELYHSPDGGGTWALVSADVPATWPPGFLQFVDLDHGFEANINGATELLITADGGKSWKSITPAI